MVVLDELNVEAELRESLRIPALHKEPADIAVDPRLEEYSAIDLCCNQLQVASLSSSAIR